MDFQAQGEAIVQRINDTELALQNTSQPGKIYTVQEQEIRSKLVMANHQARSAFSQWHRSAPKN